MTTTKHGPQGPLVTIGLVVLIALLAAMTVNAWGQQGFSSWFPVLIAAALLVTVIVGARLKVGKDGFELDTRRRREAKEELRKATESKMAGKTPALTTEARIEKIGTIRRRDILWVDDHPENNIHETRMLLHLGYRITTATSTEDAELYLRSVPFDIAITDMGRGNDPEAGITFIDRVRELGILHPPPVIVYTLDRDERAKRAAARGAAAVAVMPDELLDAVVRQTT